MLKKWVKLLVVVSLVALTISAVSDSLKPDSPAPGTIHFSVDIKDGIWKYVEASKDNNSTVIGMVYLPEPCVIQIAKQGEDYCLQLKNCDTEEIVFGVPVTKENIDQTLETIKNAAEKYMATAEALREGFDGPNSLLSSFLTALESEE